MSSPNRPNLSAEDAARVAILLETFNSSSESPQRTRIQSAMHSLRFASRVAAKFGYDCAETGKTIASEALDSNCLVLCDDIRLICATPDNNIDAPLINLLSINVVPDNVYEHRTTFSFRKIDDYYTMLDPAPSNEPQQLVVVAGSSQLIQRLVVSTLRAASIYNIQNLITVHAPNNWDIQYPTITPNIRCESMHILICDLLKAPINKAFLEQMHGGFISMFDRTPTMHLVKCLGGRVRVASLTADELQRDIFIILFSVRHCVGELFRALHVSKLSLSQASIEAFMKIFDPKKIQHLAFISCGINSESFPYILCRLSNAQCESSIRSIILTDNPIGDRGIASLIDIILLIHSQLQTLRIGRTGAANKSAVALSKLLCQTQLRRLDFSGMFLSRVAADDIATGIRGSRSLQHLSMSLGVDNSHIILEGLAGSGGSSLENLVACGTHISSKGILALGNFLTKTSALRSLMLSGTELTSDRLFTLLSSVAKNTNTLSLILDISKNNLKDGVVKALKKLMPNANDLPNGIKNIHGLFLGCNSISGRLLRRTCSYLSFLPRLELVSFDNNNCHPPNRPADGDTLAMFLSKCPQVRCLSMRSTLGDKGVRSFCKKLTTIPYVDGNLETLDISFNGMKLKSFIAFCELLSKACCYRLTNLLLDENNATLDCFHLLRSCLKANQNICIINIRQDSIAMRYKHSDDKGSICYLESILRDLQLIMVANHARLREREQDIPFPLHLCTNNIINLRDDIFDQTLAKIRSTDTSPICNRRSEFGIEIFLMDSSIPENFDAPVPIVLQLIRKALDALGAYETEGIFRIAPNQTEQTLVRSFLEQGVYPRCNDVHAIADICKQWLRALPSRLFDILLDESMSSVTSPEAAHELVKTMPNPWRSTTRYLLDICAQIVERSEVNKMNQRALAIVLSPNMIAESKLEEDLHSIAAARRFLEHAIVDTLNTRRDLVASTVK